MSEATVRSSARRGRRLLRPSQPRGWEDRKGTKIGLVPHAFRLDHSPQGEHQDFQIYGKRLSFHVGDVEINFDGNLQVIATIDLRPAGNAGNQSMDAVTSAKRN